MSIERSGRGRPRSEETRQKVLAAASSLLDEKGFRGVTMEAIASRAGASKVTLYRWWPNPAIIAMEAVLAETRAAMQVPSTGSPLEDLRLQHMRFVRVVSGKRGGRIIAGLLAESTLDPVVHEHFVKHWIEPRRVDMKDHLFKAIEAGETPREFDVECFLDALYGPVFLRLQGQHMPLNEAFAREVWRTATAGFFGSAFARTKRRGPRSVPRPRQRALFPAGAAATGRAASR
jgi:AcrR family transcriptional regulator